MSKALQLGILAAWFSVGTLARAQAVPSAPPAAPSVPVASSSPSVSPQPSVAPSAPSPTTTSKSAPDAPVAPVGSESSAVEPPGSADPSPATERAAQGPAVQGPASQDPALQDPAAAANGSSAASSAAEVPAPSAPTQPAPSANPPPAELPSAWSWARPAAAQPLTPPPIASDGGKSQAAPKGPSLPWRGTAFSWSNALTTSRVGVGRDYLSTSHQVYSQTYALLLNYYLYKDTLWSLRTSVEPELDVELSDSNETTRRHEPLLNDTRANLVGSRVLDENAATGRKTLAVANFTVLLPTSEASRAAGSYLTISPRLALTHAAPVSGGASALLKGVTFLAAGRWDHLFSDATTPVDSELSIPSQDLGGNALRSDLLSGGRTAGNSFRAIAAIEFEELFGAHLQLGFSAYYESAQLYPVGTQTLGLSTGPVAVGPAPGARNMQPNVGLKTALTYVPTPELAIALGYTSTADLGSENRNPLYTPGAQFLGVVSVSLDALYLRAKGTPAVEPSFIAQSQRRRTF